MEKSMRGMSKVRSSLRRKTRLECLEARQHLSATLVQDIHAANVPSGQSFTININHNFDDPTVTGTAVDITTPLGDIPLALTDSTTPNTVANFVSYINSGEYNN